MEFNKYQTPLTDIEWKYVEHDILAIIYYIDEQIDYYGSIAKIPLTNTGRVRQYVRGKCFNEVTAKSTGKVTYLQELIYQDIY